MKKVAAVLPTIGRIKYLDIAIESILNQSKKFDEVIVFDNSIEQNLKELSIFGANESIKFIQSGKQLNAINSWNTAVQSAVCDYVTIIGDDDIVDNNYRQEIDDILKNNEFGILKARAIDKDGDLLHNLSYPTNTTQVDSKEFRQYRFAGKLSLFVPGVVFKKEHFLRLGGFLNSNLNGLAYSDDMLYYKLSHLAGSVGISNNICWSYRIHTEQIGSLKAISNYIDKVYYYVEMLENEMKSLSVNKKDLYEKFSRHKYIERILRSELNKFSLYCINKNMYLFLVQSLIKNILFDKRLAFYFKLKIIYGVIKQTTRSFIKKVKNVK